MGYNIEKPNMKELNEYWNKSDDEYYCNKSDGLLEVLVMRTF